MGRRRGNRCLRQGRAPSGRLRRMAPKRRARPALSVSVRRLGDALEGRAGTLRGAATWRCPAADAGHGGAGGHPRLGTRLAASGERAWLRRRSLPLCCGPTPHRPETTQSLSCARGSSRSRLAPDLGRSSSSGLRRRRGACLGRSCSFRRVPTSHGASSTVTPASRVGAARGRRPRPSRRPRLATNAYVRSLAVRFGGAAHFASLWLVRDPISPHLNLIALFASPNKGLFLYAPLTLLAVIALPRAFRIAPRVAVFAALTLAGLAGGLCLLGMWSDERGDLACTPRSLRWSSAWPRRGGSVPSGSARSRRSSWRSRSGWRYRSSASRSITERSWRWRRRRRRRRWRRSRAT